ncbi:hypothetical protein [Paraburkholderia rhynchosiae]|nr:hypothetical protein [Paraburkholderia rhynchosiae]
MAELSQTIGHRLADQVQTFTHEGRGSPALSVNLPPPLGVNLIVGVNPLRAIHVERYSLAFLGIDTHRMLLFDSRNHRRLFKTSFDPRTAGDFFCLSLDHPTSLLPP